VFSKPMEVSADLFRFSSRWICGFGCDILISGYQREKLRKIENELGQTPKENSYEFSAE